MLAYRIGIKLLGFGLKISSFFNPKNKLRVHGQKEIKKIITSKKPIFSEDDFVIWVHCASLGEFEQARPIIENLKSHSTKIKLLITFFSPSGYEIRKNYALADYVCYLPLDTRKNSRLFVEFFKPKLAVFIKYEFWYYFYATCKVKKIPLFSVSTIFRPKHSFFQKNIGFNKILNFVTFFFVQNHESKELIQSIGYTNVVRSGDTRFDRVLTLRNQNHDELGIIHDFCFRPLTLVIGSAWESDLIVLKKFIEKNTSINIIIAPHEVNEKSILRIKQILNHRATLHSKLTQDNLSANNVLIIDSIGLLTSIYSLADIAYVGGAFGNGLHNILEPATYGIPTVFGQKYDKFQEAKDLVKLGGAFSISSKEEANTTLNLLTTNEKSRQKAGTINYDYVSQQAGATKIIMKHLIPYLPE